MSGSRQTAILNHLQAYWPGNTLEVFRWEQGPITKLLNSFRVCRIRPAMETEAWIYVSLNASEVVGPSDEKNEFMIMSPVEDMIHVETLAALAFYGATYSLHLGKVIDIGREWFPESKMHHFLVSLPYVQGPKLEFVNGLNVRILWLLPITEREASFVAEYGVEALESKFDEHEINVLDPNRDSVL